MLHAPLMPKATAIWLIDNTTLTFEQIANFCHLHILEVQAIADGEVVTGMTPFDPIANGQLTWEEIERCANDPKASLQPLTESEPALRKRRKGGRYTPVTKRQDKPSAVSWLLKRHPELSDAQICRLLGTTSPFIRSIRDKTHKDIANIRAKSPVELGLCSPQELEETLAEIGVSKKPTL